MSADAPYPPIADYGLLADCHSWALVCRDGSIDWCNFNTPDRRPVFARILDWERGGHLSLGPACGEDLDIERAYLDETNVLVTRLGCSHGEIELTDCLTLEADEGDVGIPPRPYGQLLRRLRISGEPTIRLEVRPRFEYGRVTPRARLRDEHLAVFVGGADAIGLQSDIPLQQEGKHAVVGELSAEDDDELWISLSYVEGHLLSGWSPVDPDEFAERLEHTTWFWREWAGLASYDGRYREAVIRSALALKSLADGRTGAIVAAATTSLPEHVGGQRNWDYRFTWIRDAALHLDALFQLGYEAEARAFFSFVGRSTAGTADDLQVFYGADGRHLMTEIDIRELDGYRGSRPVRIGNGAATQFQLDLYGEFIELIWRYHVHRGELSDEIRELLVDIAHLLEDNWSKPDKGIWEVRGDPKHFVSSKIFAWRGVDRLLALEDDLDLGIDRGRWEGLERRIAARINQSGVGEVGGLVRAFDDHKADASSLLGILFGAVPKGGEVARRTIEYIRDRLEPEDGLVFRYRSDDGLPGDQGAFFLCCFWLVSALVEMGDVDEAERLFGRLLDRRNDLGLLSEEIDPTTEDLLGNFPQAISHSSLIDAALRLEGRREPDS